jgi:hypothetical protein
MKTIVNGVTYNTDTSTALARSEYRNGDGVEITGTLYQTRGGAFFVDEEVTRQVWNEREREHQSKITHNFLPMNAEGAHKWLVDGTDPVEIFQNPFEDPPEATAEAEPGATIYIRVPAQLKRSVDDAAREARLSGNAWAMRCVEKCLAESGVPEEIVRSWMIAAIFRDHNHGKWPREKCISALCEIADLLESWADSKFGDDPMAKAIDQYDGRQNVEDAYHPYDPYPKDRAEGAS